MHQQLQNQMLFHQQQSQSGGISSHPNGSPQRRFLSEGELLSRTVSNGLSIGNELTYANRTNSTVDNIRELAGSPQRSVYNWKDTSPTGFNNQNQIGAPIPGQQQLANNSKTFIGRPPLPSTQQQQQYHQNPNKTVVISSQQQQKQPSFDFSF